MTTLPETLIPKRILFVCLGNICRSPVAEGIFRNRIAVRNLEHIFSADSCGTGNYHIGQQPDPRAVGNAARNGVVLNHRCRQLRPDDLVSFHHIIAMDSNNLRNIMALDTSGAHRDKIRLMRDWDPRTGNGDVPDPYYGDERDFQEVFEILDRCMDRFIDHLEVDTNDSQPAA